MCSVGRTGRWPSASTVCHGRRVSAGGRALARASLNGSAICFARCEVPPNSPAIIKPPETAPAVLSHDRCYLPLFSLFLFFIHKAVYF